MTNPFGRNLHHIWSPRDFSCWRGAGQKLAVLLPLFLFASSGFSQGVTRNASQTGFFDLVITVVSIVIPALLAAGVVLGIYAWLRRNRGNLSRRFRRNESTEYYDQILHDRIPLLTPKADVNLTEDRAVEQVIPLETETDSLTLESSALMALEQSLRLREEGHILQYFEFIAMTTKRYISEKYQMKIGDTGQILGNLPQNLTDSVADHVGEILRTCDMVQFSRHRPSRAETESDTSDGKGIFRKPNLRSTHQRRGTGRLTFLCMRRHKFVQK